MDNLQFYERGEFSFLPSNRINNGCDTNFRNT